MSALVFVERDPLLFMDIDDVMCLSAPYGGIHAGFAVNDRLEDPSDVWARVFTAESKAALAQVDAAVGRRLRYVISSTWRMTFDRHQMVSIFEATGLDFVAERLEPGSRWCTPSVYGSDRASEIALWLKRHHQGEAYAVVDDDFSGRRLIEAVKQGAPQFIDRLVICQERVGLLERHVPELVTALRRPGGGRWVTTADEADRQTTKEDTQ